MILVPLGILWGGYTLIWYGFSTLKGPGMGLADLVFPSRVDKANTKLNNLGAGTKGAVNPDPSTPGGFFPPGTPANPDRPAAFDPSQGRIVGRTI